MIKPALKVLAILMPILLIYGVIRVNFLGYPTAYFTTNELGVMEIHWGEMLPTWQNFLAKWESFPNLWGDVDGAITDFNRTATEMTQSFGSITNLWEFFGAIGKFFETIGSAFIIVFQVISIPVKAIYWFFAILFAPYVE